METVPKGFYYHYKHTDKDVNNYAYEVLNIAHHTEIDGLPESAMVVYRPLYKEAGVYGAGKHWDVRPLNMFLEPVTKDGVTFPRFTPIMDEHIISQLKAYSNELYQE